MNKYLTKKQTSETGFMLSYPSKYFKIHYKNVKIFLAG